MCAGEQPASPASAARDSPSASRRARSVRASATPPLAVEVRVMKPTVPPPRPPVDSPDNSTDWPQLLRWAAGLDPASRAARAIRRGAPLGELGYARKDPV